MGAVARAHIQHSWALMQLAEYAKGLVPVEAVAGHAEHVLTSSRLAVIQADVGMTAVMLDLARGAGWHLLALARGTGPGSMRATYGEYYRRWCEGEAYPWRPDGVQGLPEPCPTDPEGLQQAAEQIDTWYMGEAGPMGRDGFVRNRTPVSSILRAED